jgi:hypothetical protein
MIENSVEIYLNNSIKSVVEQGKKLLHTHLNRIGLQKG